ncbi:TrbC/VirB2 family protein [Salmonella enterica]|uniref:TriB protein n=3 Tax=Enterobacteriaceae TaxID=543 RepID=A0A5T2MF91_SALER|nr:TriB protein [Salmonella enterica]ELE3269940.1 TrbC/VirB2 family protein [Salmonella enterica subsp. enterica serovar Muenchen]EAZ4079925.1 TrbC/VirB2 family protein [Salmonella enterica]EGL2678368.1 TrbC/VirB2 family protein [Salmonella enterica]EIE8195508.1 TrbC/VirB2 family protein [Salmonella enterica]
MKFISKLKNKINLTSAYILAQAMSVFAASPVFAADGFTRANTIMQKVSNGLHGLAAITITVAVIWIGYKTLWKGESLSQCGYIIIGGILIGGGSEIGALLMS